MAQLPFNVVKGSDAAIKASRPLPGYLWFALDTRKIYYSDGEDFISMGGNSSIFFGTLTWPEDNPPDSDQVEFDFTPADIEGDATPNINDLILNSDGCFYRVMAVNNGIIKAFKLTIAGSGSGGGGGGGHTPITSVITIVAPVSTKYFLETEKNPSFSFEVHSNIETGNKISKITYTIGSKTYIDDEPHKFGTITFNLQNYFNSISESGTAFSFIVEDNYGGKKTSPTYTLRKVKLLLTTDSSNKDNILQATNKALQYRVIPTGSSSIQNVAITYDILVEGSNTPIFTTTKNLSSLNGSVINQDFNFEEIDETGNGLGAYQLRIVCTGTAGGQTVTSNILSHSVISYGKEPVLIAYLPTRQVNQYDSVDVSFEIAKSVIDNQKARITIEVDGEQNIQEVEYNNIYTYNVYFETTGYHSIIVRDAFGHTQSFTDIYVTPYDGAMQVIDNSDIDLMLNLTARGRNNNEITESRKVWTDKRRDHHASLSNFVWGNVNGWLLDDENANMLRISSGASMVVTDYQPFGLNANSKEGMETGKTIELDFRISNVTDYSKPLITCLSYDTNKNILCGFNITGEAATFNTHNIKATTGSIVEGDSEEDQAYNTQIQGLTAKFAEGERIHLTWVIQKKTETYPMIKTYINGIVSGITEYKGGTDASSDSIKQNSTTGAEPALIKINSSFGTVDVYNIRVFNKDLTDRQILENYIATLATTEQKTNCYNNNIGLLDSNGKISVNNIESGNYQITLPYIKFTGGGQCRKGKKSDPDPKGYYLTNKDGTNHLPRAKKDYRLVNHFDFVFPTDTSRNVDLISTIDESKGNLINGVIMYGQGTSSMEYPVKNLRIKFKMKQDGKKVLFQVNPNDYPVDILTLKADYMESSSSHNTGTANLIFDALESLGFHTPGQTYWNAQNPNYKTLTAIRGYPIMCFFREDEDHDFEFIGRYNLNMDKSSENAFGFLPVPEKESQIDENGNNIEFGWMANDGTKSNLDPIEHPYVNAIHCYEFLNNASNLDNFIVGNTGLNFHDLFYQEVLNDDGEIIPNWLTSFESRYPEDSTDVESFYQMCAWVNSTNPDEATNNQLAEPVIYNSVEYTLDNREYRLAKFKNEFEEHFNKNFVLFYYVLSHVLLMIDSRAKNMMIATWDNQIWYPIFYDMDTMLGLNNYGYNKFDYNVEDKDANVFNGQASVLWNNVKACFEADIRTMYNEMQKYGGLNYGNLLRNYNTVQADMWNEIMYNYDAVYKYITPYAEGYYDGLNLDENGNPVIVTPGTKNYLYAAQGSRSMHRRYWLKNRISYFDGKYLSDNYRTDKFTMRIYTPEAGADNYFRVYNVNASNFNERVYYTRSKEPPYIFTIAEAFVAGTEYYAKADNKLAASLAVVPPNNNYTLTPLHNQYLAVAFGGTNGQTSGPWYAEANIPYLVAAPEGAKYNDTETYVYGASQIKDLGDLSSQYLGLFSFPGETKLETLILGNKTNGYYNPNFSALSIGAAAPQLKVLDISNTQLTGVLDLSKCQNITQVFACGSSISSVSLPSYGVLQELRLPTTITSLVMDTQTNLTNDKFTIGTYDSNTETYTNASEVALTTISIEGMPQFDSYPLLKASCNHIMGYCLRDISWTIDADDIVSTSDGLKGIAALETLLDRNAEPQYKGSSTSTMRALTGTVTFRGAIDPSDTLLIYEHYQSIYPDLVFEFDESNIKHVNLYSGDGNIYWSKPIAVGSELTIDFYDASSYGAFTIPQKTGTQEYKYIFDNKWLLNEQEIDSSTTDGRPIISGLISSDLNFIPQFTQEIQTYTATFHLDSKTDIVSSYSYGTPYSTILPKIVPFCESNSALTESNRLVYPFLGYSANSAQDTENLIDFSDSSLILTSNKEFYAVFGQTKVDAADSLNVFYPAWEFNQLVSYDDSVIYNTSPGVPILTGNISYNLEGYVATPANGWVFEQFVTIPAKYNGKDIVEVKGFEANKDINKVYFENGTKIRVIGYAAFQDTQNLTYVDFPDSLRQICNYAFQRSSLILNTSLGGKNTTVIGQLAFNSCLKGAEGKTYQIPSSVCIICQGGLSNMPGHHCKIQIGSSDELSHLNLSIDTAYDAWNSENGRYILRMNDGEEHSSIDFYTNTYSNATQIVKDDVTVASVFFGDGSITTLNILTGNG